MRWLRSRLQQWLERRKLEREFKSLLKQWHREAGHLSVQSWDHPAYQAIVRMGKPVLPFIFKRLRENPDHLFVALVLITGENPVPEYHQGRMLLMTQDWLRWAREHGYYIREDL